MVEKNERIGIEFGMGWLPDYPDFRDFTVEQKSLRPRHSRLGLKKEKDSISILLERVGVVEPAKASIPTSCNLRKWCSPIENQGSIGSCTANAGVSLLEYYERRTHGKYTDASRLFLYKATRNLLHWTGDTGAFLRTTMGAMVLFGVCPEEYWPYAVADFDQEPPSFCYAFAQDFQTLLYYRLDPPNTSNKEALLQRIKVFLTAGLPSMFGFTVFASITQARNDGKIPFPCPRERILGGHAVVVVGFDDKIEIENEICGVKTSGALLIRNSWGTGWGENGYGWLPYAYVRKSLAIDWWSIIKTEWIDTKIFEI